LMRNSLHRYTLKYVVASESIFAGQFKAKPATPPETCMQNR
jgi:hypothetical protein